jgi:hypothetical protein
MGTRVEEKIFRCSFCGAEFSIPKTFVYATCPYCGTTTRVDNPDAKVDHFIFAINYDKNSSYRRVKDFALMQVGIAEDFNDNVDFDSAYQYLVPLYIYEVDVKAVCREEVEKIEENEVEISIHGGEEAAHVVVIALENPPINIPKDYSFPAKNRIYFKPSILREGVYLNPSLDPETVFEKIKRPYIEKTLSEAETACGKKYRFADNSRFVGLAHYPFWIITCNYRGRKYRAIVDAADGTVLYLEYPISFKQRLKGLVGGIGFTLTASIIGTAISYTLSSNIIYSTIGGTLTALPGLAIAINKFSRSKGVYKYKPSEEAIFTPIR